MHQELVDNPIRLQKKTKVTQVIKRKQSDTPRRLLISILQQLVALFYLFIAKK